MHGYCSTKEGKRLRGREIPEYTGQSAGYRTREVLLIIKNGSKNLAKEVKKMKAKLMKIILVLASLLLAGGANFRWGG